MTQWIPNKRRQEKVITKRTVKRMTQGADSGPRQTENGEDTTGIPDESESDAGSDIFMPGGITMKATELPSDHDDPKEDKNDSDHSEHKDDVDIKSPSNNQGASIDDEDKLKECENPTDNSPMIVSKENSPISEQNAGNVNGEDDKMTPDSPSADSPLPDSPSADSPSSCLEINMEDDSAFPCSNKEKIINSVHEKNTDLEERNIFTNISNLLETSAENSENEEENKAETFEEKDQDNKPEEREVDDEHQMSEDFKIGLRQKSYDVDPFCPDKPPQYEVIEGNLYLIDKYV